VSTRILIGVRDLELADPTRGLDAVEGRHAQIHEHDVGLEATL
jgi:hypothetical protein